MSSKHTILSGALVLREFTVPELVQFTRQKKQTIYSVLRRHKHYFEISDNTSETRRAGGQIRRYVVKLDQASALRSELGAVLDLPYGPKNQDIVDINNDISRTSTGAISEMLEAMEGDFGGLEPIKIRTLKRGLLAQKTVENLHTAALASAKATENELNVSHDLARITESLAKFIRLYARHKLTEQSIQVTDRDDVQLAHSELGKTLLMISGRVDLDPLVRNIINTISASKAYNLNVQRELPCDLSVTGTSLQTRQSAEALEPILSKSNIIFLAKTLNSFDVTISQEKHDSGNLVLMRTDERNAEPVATTSTENMNNRFLSRITAAMELLSPNRYDSVDFGFQPA